MIKAIWVPGNSRIARNFNADELARKVILPYYQQSEKESVLCGLAASYYSMIRQEIGELS